MIFMGKHEKEINEELDSYFKSRRDSLLKLKEWIRENSNYKKKEENNEIKKETSGKPEMESPTRQENNSGSGLKLRLFSKISGKKLEKEVSVLCERKRKLVEMQSDAIEIWEMSKKLLKEIPDMEKNIIVNSRDYIEVRELMRKIK